MKKIFTLVFSAALLTSAAFAQNDRRHQDDQNSANRYPQTQNPVYTQQVPVYNHQNDQGGYSKTYGTNGGYGDQARNDDHRNNGQWNQPMQKQYGFDRQREMREEMRQREIMKQREEMMRRQRFNQRNQRRFDDRYDQRGYNRSW